MLKVKLLIPVTFEGSIVPAGEELELSKRSAQALVDEGSAELSNVEGATPGVTGAEKKEDPTLAEEQAQASADELEKVRKALDDKYKRDELAKVAKDMGVEFPYDAKKPDIIEDVITAGKATAILQL